MKNLKNHVSLIGRAGENPEIVEFANGNKLAKLSIAIQERIYSPKGVIATVNWHNIVAWGKKAEQMERFVEKGQLLVVEGKLRNKLENRNGVPTHISEILCSHFMMLNRKKMVD